MSDENDGPYTFPDVGSLIAHPEGMTVQAAMDLAQMDCDVLKDDVRQEPTECKAGPQSLQSAQTLRRKRDKVPRGTSEGKETGDA